MIYMHLSDKLNLPREQLFIGVSTDDEPANEYGSNGLPGSQMEMTHRERQVNSMKNDMMPVRNRPETETE